MREEVEKKKEWEEREEEIGEKMKDMATHGQKQSMGQKTKNREKEKKRRLQ